MVLVTACTSIPSLPKDWPSWVTQYPNSTLKSGDSRPLGRYVMMRAELLTSDTPDQVFKYYEDKATKQGFTSINKSKNGIWHDSNMPQLGSNMTFTKTSEILSVTCKTNAHGTSISIMYEAIKSKHS